jgi:hypothetical protein
VVAESGVTAAERQSFPQLDSAIESAVQTVLRALDLLDGEPHARRRRQSKAARDRQQTARFCRRQLMRLVDLRTRVSWHALDTPGALTQAVQPPPRWFRSAPTATGDQMRRESPSALRALPSEPSRPVVSEAVPV